MQLFQLFNYVESRHVFRDILPYASQPGHLSLELAAGCVEVPARLEDAGGAADEDRGALLYAPPAGFLVDAAVHRDRDAPSPASEQSFDRGDLWQDGGNELLAGKPRIHRHQQDVFDLVDDARDGVDRRPGVEGDAGLDPHRPDGAEQTEGTPDRLDMEGDVFRAGPGDGRNKQCRIVHHEVNHQGRLRDRADLGREVEAQAEVRHKMSVHHVEMIQVDGRAVHRANVLFQTEKVGTHEGGRELYHLIPLSRAKASTSAPDGSEGCAPSFKTVRAPAMFP